MKPFIKADEAADKALVIFHEIIDLVRKDYRAEDKDDLWEKYGEMMASFEGATMADMGSRGGKVGGINRGKSLSKERLIEIAKMGARARWKKK